MSGTLQPMAGVSKIDIKEGEEGFTVEFDPAKVSVESMLAALQAKEPKTAVVK